eukprot:CAMPEP_0172162380 /NCGR_PEP_ID=MMETSP1050-20130122/6637_1 /TAXON_ID=233186 /ORGANISM="Cryptomonas curvata, Strain CCAP979/52" /LENGTH=50 /DNA_ID=CAMNT_0012832359 /DNA_START=148 /DNA_END=297 /DNA_ORIENTATION=-
MPEAQAYVQELLVNIRKGRPIIAVQGPGLGFPDGSSPNKAGAGKAPVLSP